MKTLRFILFLLLLPLSMWYAVVMALCNWRYNRRNVQPTPNTIGIGNLLMGGTGKTPHTEYLIRLLEGRRVALLSRGYGRKSKGYILADGETGADMLGDEPAMMAKKFEGLTVAVCEDRVEGVKRLMQTDNPPDVVLMDDVYQHRSIRPAVNILLTEYSAPFFRDYILPFGNLREFRCGRRRADIIVVTKCPQDMSDNERNHFVKRLDVKEGQQVFFSYIEYGQPVPLYGGEDYTQADNLLVVTGIAHPEPLLKHLQKEHTVTHLRFSDHHGFGVSDCRKIKEAFDEIVGSKAVITTEKDAVRMLVPEVRELLGDLPLFYLPIKVRFFDEEAFNNTIIKKLS